MFSFVNSLFFDSATGTNREFGITNSIENAINPLIIFSYNYGKIYRVNPLLKAASLKDTYASIAAFAARLKDNSIRKRGVSLHNEHLFAITDTG